MIDLQKGQIVSIRLPKMGNSIIECEFLGNHERGEEWGVFRPIRIAYNATSMAYLEVVLRVQVIAHQSQIINNK